MAEFAFFGMLVLIALFAGALALALAAPGTFRYERRATINAPADKIFPLINDFHAWPAWSPWEKLDPNMQRTYSGAPSGLGAVYNWDGKKAGAGRMEITDSSPSKRLVVKLDFTKPMTAHNTTDFVLEPAGAGTNVIWSMYGPNPVMSKVMGLVINMDKMIGKDFEAGLANLKAAAEK
jgi:carbon monoxide dehydrogenase subunit G